MTQTRLAPTANRSVVGVLNEFSRLIDYYRADGDGLVEMSLQLAKTPLSPLFKRHISPDRELAAYVAERHLPDTRHAMKERRARTLVGQAVFVRAGDVEAHDVDVVAAVAPTRHRRRCRRFGLRRERRSAVRTAKRTNDDAAVTAARARVGQPSASGERGTPWWEQDSDARRERWTAAADELDHP